LRATFFCAARRSRYLSHVKRLRGIADGIARLRERIEPMLETPKMGPLLWQLPENFHRDDERLAGALEVLPKGRHAFEFRHPSWFTAEVYELLRRYGVALVIGDHPKWPFQTHERTADWTFIRFHHGRRGRKGKYADSELDTWARRLAQWRRQTELYAYFNNDWQGFAIANARMLRSLLRRAPSPAKTEGTSGAVRPSPGSPGM